MPQWHRACDQLADGRCPETPNAVWPEETYQVHFWFSSITAKKKFSVLPSSAPLQRWHSRQSGWAWARQKWSPRPVQLRQSRRHTHSWTASHLNKIESSHTHQTLFPFYIKVISLFFLFILKYACMRTQLCPALCDLMDCNPPGSSVHGISQTRILEWVAIFSSFFLTQG